MTHGNPDDPVGPTPPQAEALKPVFTGGRFDGASGYPADALNELAAYAKLIEAVAVSRHRSREGRRRAERGYAERVRLRLKRVDEGSAVPVLYCSADAVDEVREAQNSIIEQLRSSKGVAPEFQRHFRAFGRTLSEDEGIQLRGTASWEFRYTAATRMKILETTGQTDIDDVDVFGKIVATTMPEESEPWLMLKVANGGPTVKMRMSLDEIRKALDRGVSDRLVQVRGTAEFLADGEVSEIKKVDELRVVDSGLEGARESLVDQFERLQREGASPHSRFRTFLEYCIAEGMDTRPYVVATDDGVEAEWRIGRTNTTATFLTNFDVYVHCTHLDRKTYRETTVHCDYVGAARLAAWWLEVE